MSGRSVLVTGGGGFVGRHLIRRLTQQGDQVTCILKGGEHAEAAPAEAADVEYVWHDGSMSGMSALVDGAAPSAVFHLASLFISEHKTADVEPLVMSNVLFGTQLLEAVAARRGEMPTLVNVGTSWQHFSDDSYDPVNLYAATKQAFEDVLTFYVNARSLPAATVKLFDTYGPNDPRPKLVSLLGSIAASGETLAMSAGDQKLDLVHVDDVVSALIAAESGLRSGAVPPGSAYAVSSGQRLTLKEVVATYERASGRRVSIEWGGRPYREREVLEPWSSGPPVPGWAPKWSLEAGFRDVLR